MNGHSLKSIILRCVRWPLRGLRGRRHSSLAQVPIHDWARTQHSSGQLAWQRIDQSLIMVVTALLALGLVMVYSASVALPDSPRFMRYESTHFVARHAVSIALGGVLGAMALQVPMSVWERHAPKLFLLALFLLIIVLIPFIGKGVNGARRWISLGIINFQPSEFAKLAMVLYASNYMVRKMAVREHFFRALLPMVLALGLTGGLLLAEPDMGAFVVIAAISLGILFLGGVNHRTFFLSIAIFAGAFALMIFFSEFRRQRIFAYLDPWNPTYAQGKAYQLTHALIAFGRGELFGQGLGNSLEKLFYLPEAHTDFILAVIAEELGFVAVTSIALAFIWLTYRCFSIGRQAIILNRVFSGLVAQGVGIWLGFQSLFNIGVNLGALPTKGLTLPLLSYGGSGMIMNFIALALVLRVDLETRQMMRGARL
jgi:cell division protein FtsW